MIGTRTRHTKILALLPTEIFPGSSGLTIHFLQNTFVLVISHFTASQRDTYERYAINKWLNKLEFIGELPKLTTSLFL